jgi:hypothetical protein
MQDSFSQHDPYGVRDRFQPPSKSRSKLWIWLLVGGGVFVVLPCAGCLGFLMYLGSVSPETSIYAGNEVPNRFIRTMKDVGALDEDETILFFYSEALTDIRDSFSFVSDKRVVVYSESAGGSPLTSVPFDQIEDLDLFRNTSFFEDSVITLQLKDGRPVTFPVSSDADLDEQFFEAIQKRVGTPAEGSDQ